MPNRSESECMNHPKGHPGGRKLRFWIYLVLLTWFPPIAFPASLPDCNFTAIQAKRNPAAELWGRLTQHTIAAGADLTHYDGHASFACLVRYYLGGGGGEDGEKRRSRYDRLAKLLKDKAPGLAKAVLEHAEAARDGRDPLYGRFYRPVALDLAMMSGERTAVEQWKPEGGEAAFAQLEMDWCKGATKAKRALDKHVDAVDKAEWREAWGLVIAGPVERLKEWPVQELTGICDPGTFVTPDDHSRVRMAHEKQAKGLIRTEYSRLFKEGSLPETTISKIKEIARWAPGWVLSDQQYKSIESGRTVQRLAKSTLSDDRKEFLTAVSKAKKLAVFPAFSKLGMGSRAKTFVDNIHWLIREYGVVPPVITPTAPGASRVPIAIAVKDTPWTRGEAKWRKKRGMSLKAFNRKHGEGGISREIYNAIRKALPSVTSLSELSTREPPLAELVSLPNLKEAFDHLGKPFRFDQRNEIDAVATGLRERLRYWEGIDERLMDLLALFDRPGPRVEVRSSSQASTKGATQNLDASRITLLDMAKAERREIRQRLACMPDDLRIFQFPREQRADLSELKKQTERALALGEEKPPAETFQQFEARWRYVVKGLVDPAGREIGDQSAFDILRWISAFRWIVEHHLHHPPDISGKAGLLNLPAMDVAMPKGMPAVARLAVNPKACDFGKGKETIKPKDLVPRARDLAETMKTHYSIDDNACGLMRSVWQQMNDRAVVEEVMKAVEEVRSQANYKTSPLPFWKDYPDWLAERLGVERRPRELPPVPTPPSGELLTIGPP